MSTDTLQLELAKQSDAAAMSVLSRDEIEHGLGWRYTPQRLVQVIRHPAKNAVVARRDGVLVGFGVMTYRRNQANLDLLAVAPEHRRHRVGSELVRWLENVADTAGCYNVFVQLRSRNARATAFYRALDYHALGRVPRYYQGVEDATVMAKSLRPMVG
ncbi:MAG: GNAT family N-acetyltransferase [Pseudomonadota bacterium]